MTHRFWNRMLSRLALALGLTLAFSWTASPALAAPAKAKPAATAKAKKAGKGKAVTAGKGAKNSTIATAKAGKSGKKAKTAAKDTKVGKETKAGKGTKATGKNAKTAGKGSKATAKDGKATEKDAKPSKDAKAGKSAEEIAKTGKPKSKKGLSAKTAPIDPTEAMEEEVDEFESDAKEKDRASTSPMLYVFILFIIGCVAGYLYMKKKQEIKASGANSGDFTSSHGEVFGSNLSSLNADTRRTDRSLMDGGGDDTTSTGKKGGWKQSKLFTSISEQLKGSPKKSFDASSKNIPSKLSSGSPSELGSDSREATAKSQPQRTTEKAASKSTTAATPAPSMGGAAEQPVKLETPAPLKQTQVILPAPAVDDALITHVGAPPANGVTNEAKIFTDPPLTDADWNGWDKIDAEEFWYRVKKIDQEGIDSGDDAYVAALKQVGFRDRLHYERVKDAYRARFPGASDPQAMMNASTRAADEKLRSTPNPKMFEPIAGVSLEVYADFMARRAGLPANDSEAFDKLLGEMQLSKAQYEEANRGWQMRMADRSDLYTANALTTDYHERLAAASQRKSTEVAAATAGTTDASGSSGSPGSSEPCSFERYVEIREAQNCWSQQGKDIAGMLLETFQLTVADWSVIAQFWSEKFLANSQLAGDDSVFTERYRQKFGYVQAS